MDDAEWEIRMMEFETNVLTELKVRLALREAELAQGPLTAFTGVITELAQSMMPDAMEILGEPDGTPDYIRRGVNILGRFARRLNEALPRSHPYCVGVIEQKEEDGNVSYAAGALIRARFPEMLLESTENDFPFVRIANTETGPQLRPSDTPEGRAQCDAVTKKMTRFDERIMMPIAERFVKRAERRRACTLESFTPLVLSTCTYAHRRFLKFIGGVRATLRDPMLDWMGMFAIARSLNRVLPFGFPFCVALFESLDGTSFQFIVIERMLNRDIPMAIEEDRVPVVQSGNSYITFLPSERFGMLEGMPPPILS